jgi:hypothetical protein
MEERRERREKESNHQTDEQRTERRGVRERGCGDAKGVATERERERERKGGGYSTDLQMETPLEL